MKYGEAVRSVLVGFEIETTHRYKCLECKYNPCEECSSPCDRCGLVTRTFISNKLKERGICVSPFTKELCKYCKKYGLQEIVCKNCSLRDYPCDACTIRDGNKPFGFSREVEDYILKSYIDCGLGMEVCTKPLTFDVAWKILPKVVDEIEEKCNNGNGSVLSPVNGCGGHFTLSMMEWKSMPYEVWNKEVPRIYANITYFADVLTYMFLTEWTFGRDSDFFRELRATCVYYLNDSMTNNKYSHIFLKPYGIEVRMFDTPVYPYNHLLAVASCIGLFLVPKVTSKLGTDNRKNKVFYNIKTRYCTHCRGVFMLSKTLYNKFWRMLSLIRVPLKHLSTWIGYDLLGMLVWRFYNPCHKTGEVPIEEFVLDF